MGDSLHSIGEWIGVITFLAVIIAGANTRIQSSAIWLCLGLWFAIVVLYLLVKLIRARVNVRSSQTGTYRKDRGPLQRLVDKEQYLKNTIVEGSVSQQLQISKSKEAGFKLPSLAGFSPRRLPGSTSKKPRRQASPSQDSVSKEGDFKLPRLAGFAPGQPQEPTNKKPRRQASPSQDSVSKEGDFELPPLAGFTPGQPQEPTNKKPGQEPSPSQGYVPPGLPPELFLQ